MATAKPHPQRVGVMLAKAATENLIASLPSYIYAQPKLRGQRCRVQWLPLEDQLYPILLSSYGNQFMFLPHIERELLAMPAMSYDGELYVHDPEWTQQKINSVLGRTINPHPEAHRIEYHIFDTAYSCPQYERVESLKRCSFSSQSSIHGVTTTLIERSSWASLAATFISNGYEGIILRHPEATYAPLGLTTNAKRPSTMLKFKPSCLDTYLIVGVTEGIGWATGMLGAFIVSDEAGTTFSVGTGPELTKARRQHYWSHRDSLPGQYLQVKHEPITTSNNKPICTVAYQVMPTKGDSE